MNVEANAIEQIIDFSIPEQKMMLAIYLTAPEIENTRRAMNTTQGNDDVPRSRQMVFYTTIRDTVIAGMTRINR